MRIRTQLCLLAVFLLGGGLLLSGCEAIGFLSLAPIKVGLAVQSYEQFIGSCPGQGGLFIDPPAFDRLTLVRSGLAPLPPDIDVSDATLVGWERELLRRPDIDDFCAEFRNDIFEGGVRFVMDSAANKVKTGKVIDRAVLGYKVLESVHRASISKPLGFKSCAERLGVATSKDWPDLKTVTSASGLPATIPAVSFVTLPSDKSAVLFDVTAQVKAWVKDIVAGKKDGITTNFGFVFTAAEEKTGVIKDSAACVSILGNFRLTVTFK